MQFECIVFLVQFQLTILEFQKKKTILCAIQSFFVKVTFIDNEKQMEELRKVDENTILYAPFAK